MREVLAFSIAIIPQNQWLRIGNQAILGAREMGKRADFGQPSTKRNGVLR
jgi:hypothetical protein